MRWLRVARHGVMMMMTKEKKNIQKKKNYKKEENNTSQRTKKKRSTEWNEISTTRRIIQSLAIVRERRENFQLSSSLNLLKIIVMLSLSLTFIKCKIHQIVSVFLDEFLRVLKVQS
jgi:hypothetical protein